MSRLWDDWGASTSLLKFIAGNDTEIPANTGVSTNGTTTRQDEMQNDDATKGELDLDDLDSDEVDEAAVMLDKQSSKQTEEKTKIQHPYVLTKCVDKVADFQRERVY